jgi:hypothetical protein
MTEDVTRTIQDFVHGADTRDAERVRGSLHPDAQHVVRRPGGDLRLDVPTWLGMLADGRAGGTPRDLVVHDVEIRGGLATAHATATSAAMRFDQAYVLARGPEGWRILTVAAEASARG